MECSLRLIAEHEQIWVEGYQKPYIFKSFPVSAFRFAYINYTALTVPKNVFTFSTVSSPIVRLFVQRNMRSKDIRENRICDADDFRAITVSDMDIYRIDFFVCHVAILYFTYTMNVYSLCCAVLCLLYSKCIWIYLFAIVEDGQYGVRSQLFEFFIVCECTKIACKQNIFWILKVKRAGFLMGVHCLKNCNYYDFLEILLYLNDGWFECIHPTYLSSALNFSWKNIQKN